MGRLHGPRARLAQAGGTRRPREGRKDGRGDREHGEGCGRQQDVRPPRALQRLRPHGGARRQDLGRLLRVRGGVRPPHAAVAPGQPEQAVPAFAPRHLQRGRGERHPADQGGDLHRRRDRRDLPRRAERPRVQGQALLQAEPHQCEHTLPRPRAQLLDDRVPAAQRDQGGPQVGQLDPTAGSLCGEVPRRHVVCVAAAIANDPGAEAPALVPGSPAAARSARVLVEPRGQSRREPRPERGAARRAHRHGRAAAGLPGSARLHPEHKAGHGPVMRDGQRPLGRGEHTLRWHLEMAP
mmetsp:Transcript_47615/g.132302  ORF Transcript_47615/g.132302 Transcript_47615/m.132302 type:complete len:295 (+) Transcript_47615:302-1186(+)